MKKEYFSFYFVLVLLLSAQLLFAGLILALESVKNNRDLDNIIARQKCFEVQEHAPIGFLDGVSVNVRVWCVGIYQGTSYALPLELFKVPGVDG